jgi:hypothetical protein
MYVVEPYCLGMKTDDNRHVGCEKGGIVDDVMHGVRVTARNTSKLGVVSTS